MSTRMCSFAPGQSKPFHAGKTKFKGDIYAEFSLPGINSRRGSDHGVGDPGQPPDHRIERADANSPFGVAVEPDIEQLGGLAQLGAMLASLMTFAIRS